MTPDIHINMMALLIAVVANFIFGSIWYMPLFGKTWGKEMGFSMDEKPATSEMVKGMLGMVIGNFLMAWVFANNMAVWNPVTWGLAPSPMSPSANSIMAAVFTWAGFYLPGDIGSITWERKSTKLFYINTVYKFLSLLITAMILANMV